MLWLTPSLFLFFWSEMLLKLVAEQINCTWRKNCKSSLWKKKRLKRELGLWALAPSLWKKKEKKYKRMTGNSSGRALKKGLYVTCSPFSFFILLRKSSPESFSYLHTHKRTHSLSLSLCLCLCRIGGILKCGNGLWPWKWWSFQRRWGWPWCSPLSG